MFCAEPTPLRLTPAILSAPVLIPIVMRCSFVVLTLLVATPGLAQTSEPLSNRTWSASIGGVSHHHGGEGSGAVASIGRLLSPTREVRFSLSRTQDRFQSQSFGLVGVGAQSGAPLPLEEAESLMAWSDWQNSVRTSVELSYLWRMSSSGSVIPLIRVSALALSGERDRSTRTYQVAVADSGTNTESSGEALRTTERGGGAAVDLGVEWFVAPRVGLRGEAGLTVGGARGTTVNRNTGVSSPRTLSDVYQHYRVQIGLSFYL